MPKEETSQDTLYEQAAGTYRSALDRLARAYELDADIRRDLLQEIHLHLWRSFSKFDQRCSLRTWVHRVAHNVATSHVIRQRRLRDRLVNLEDMVVMPVLVRDIITPLRMLADLGPIFALLILWLAIFIPTRKRRQRKLQQEIDQLRAFESECQV